MDVRGLLEQWNIRPSKGLGQNFIIDRAALDKIVAAAELTRSDTVLEIGAGLGTLTERLAREAGRVVAVELDARLIPILQGVLSDLNNVTLIQGDILTLDPAALLNPPNNLQSAICNLQSAICNLQSAICNFKVVANLPYYITSAVLRHLLEARVRPRRMVITVQREVAERIVARPGDMSLLAVSVQFYGRPQMLFRLRPGSFYPAPEVESAVVRIDAYETPPVPVEDVEGFFRVVRAGFAQRRKQLRNTLAAGLGFSPDEVASRLQEAGVDPRRRAETLSLEEWAAVARALGEG